jgi:adenylate cyclase
MSMGDAQNPAQTPETRLRFGRYVLDVDRGCLLLDGTEIVLRPKTFSVLRYLAENSDRLVTKDDLFAAVWPNLAVTDDTLVQSIVELRRALGNDGSRLIKTIPRRGYRFEPSVLAAGSSTTADQAAASPAPDQDEHAPSFLHLSGTILASAAAVARANVLVSLAVAILVVGGGVFLAARTGWTSLKSPPTGTNSSKAAEDLRPAIAILPFVNQSHDQAREYFADGLTQDVINALGRFSSLTVMSWNAVLPYKDKPAGVMEIARSLAVRYQVEGSVFQTGDRVRVAARLVNADGRVLWSARFDEALADLFALQDKVATQVAGAMAIRVEQVEQRRVFAKPTANLQAYDYVLRARPALQRPTRANIVEARALLRKAIELDPNYAAAYSALAETYFSATSMGWAESPLEVLSRASEMASKALSLDGTDVRAHVILGRIYIFHQQYEQAKAEMEYAIAINPSDGNGIAGRGNILMWLGQTDAAIQALELAQRIDPDLNSMDRFALSLAYYLRERYAASIEQAEVNLRENGGANFSRIVLAAAYAQREQTDEVARVVATIRRLDPALDAGNFGSKFLNPADLERLRDGLRKAGLLAMEAGPLPSHN